MKEKAMAIAQTHRECGGYIVFTRMLDNNYLGFVCIRCYKAFATKSTINIPKDICDVPEGNRIDVKSQ